jgi:hypothetical protein
VEHVFNWMLRRKVDVLSKQIILFPIEQNKHWSLVVAYYPGLVRNTTKSISPHPRNVKPVMVHLDSLGCHDGEQLCDNLRVFFNFVWSQKRGIPLTLCLLRKVYLLLFLMVCSNNLHISVCLIWAIWVN